MFFELFCSFLNYIELSGGIHFNDAVKFTVNPAEGQISFLRVAVHDIGHSIGLGHSTDKDAMMFPFYEKSQHKFQLSEDDVLGVQALYGKRRMSA